ncbi:hypothetical protein JCM10207_004801 [Rhodosporidiobolus poonsookiae]
MRSKNVWFIEWEGREMVVKGGEDVDESEAEWTKLAKQLTSLPVPEVYGVRRDGPSTYIYFEKLPGKAIFFDFLQRPKDEQDDLLIQLRNMIAQLNVARPATLSGPVRVGGLGPKPLAAILPATSTAFPSTSSTAKLHKLLESLSRGHSSRQQYKKLVKPELHKYKRRPLVLVHGDLHAGNILVHEGKISGIVDWERAGWYPEWVETFATLRHALSVWGAYTVNWLILRQHLGGEVVHEGNVRERLGWMFCASDAWSAAT